MGPPATSHARQWMLAAFAALGVLWLLGDVLLPFVAGAMIAYFLDPVAGRLQGAGLSRTAATALIGLVALGLTALILLALVPAIASQLAALAEAAPQMARRFATALAERFPGLTDETSPLREALATVARSIQDQAGTLARGLVASAASIVSIVMFLVIAPVTGFYLLLDWRPMLERIDALLPREHAGTIRRLAREADRALAGFVRGQVTVCLVLAVWYTVGLRLAGLDYALVVGAVAGAITIIPYAGALFGAALALGLALFQFWGDWVAIGAVAAVFATGQFLEGNILTPRLVGRSVGLHPVWLLFALAAFGALFGFVGLLVAVPAAAVIGVLARFAVARYQESPLFLGGEGPAPDGTAAPEAGKAGDGVGDGVGRA